MHILDLEVGEVAVLDGLAQDLAGVGGVDMEVDDVIVLDADDAVAVGLGEGAHLCGACTLVLVDEELGAVAVLDVLDLHQVVGEDALAGVFGGELGLVGDSLAAGHDGLAVEDLAHTLKDDHDALTAGVHDASLLQDGQQVGSVLQSLLTGGHHDVPQLGHVLFAAGSSFLGSDAGDGQDGAFGGLHDSFVSALDALLQRSHDVGGVSLFLALQSFGEAAEQQAGDDAGVAAGAAQHGGGGGLCGLAHGAAVVHGLQLTDGCTDGHAHVGAGVAVGDGEHVQLVHAGALVVDVVCAGNNGVAQDLTRNHCFLLLISSRYPRAGFVSSGNHVIDRYDHAGDFQAGGLLNLVLHAVRDGSRGGGDVQPVADGNVQLDHETALFLCDTDALGRIVHAAHGAADTVGQITGGHCGHAVALFGCFAHERGKILG